MTFRAARLEDTAALVAMACRFIAESSYRGDVIPNPAHQARLVEHLLEHGAIFVAEHEPRDPIGFIAYALVPAVLSGELTACEIAWWLEPEWRKGRTGLQLLDMGEAWAEQIGAAAIQASAPVGDDTAARIYGRRGYRQLETLWTRRVAA